MARRSDAEIKAHGRMTSSLSKLYLVCHGGTDWAINGRHAGRLEIPLSARGKQNARRVGKHVGHLRFKAILARPGLRARRAGESHSIGPGCDRARDEPAIPSWYDANHVLEDPT